VSLYVFVCGAGMTNLRRQCVYVLVCLRSCFQAQIFAILNNATAPVLQTLTITHVHTHINTYIHTQDDHPRVIFPLKGSSMDVYVCKDFGTVMQVGKKDKGKTKDNNIYIVNKYVISYVRLSMLSHNGRPPVSLDFRVESKSHRQRLVCVCVICMHVYVTLCCLVYVCVKREIYVHHREMGVREVIA